MIADDRRLDDGGLDACYRVFENGRNVFIIKPVVFFFPLHFLVRRPNWSIFRTLICLHRFLA